MAWTGSLLMYWRHFFSLFWDIFRTVGKVSYVFRQNGGNLQPFKRFSDMVFGVRISRLNDSVVFRYVPGYVHVERFRLKRGVRRLMYSRIDLLVAYHVLDDFNDGGVEVQTDFFVSTNEAFHEYVLYRGVDVCSIRTEKRWFTGCRWVRERSSTAAFLRFACLIWPSPFDRADRYWYRIRSLCRSGRQRRHIGPRRAHWLLLLQSFVKLVFRSTTLQLCRWSRKIDVLYHVWILDAVNWGSVLSKRGLGKCRGRAWLPCIAIRAKFGGVDKLADDLFDRTIVFVRRFSFEKQLRSEAQ